jgi:DNA-binding XRE family transcriptional regulator
VRAEALESGRVNPDALARAQIEQDAYVAGYRLAELRGKAGMTQTQLAEAMGVSQARVSAMERGELDSLTVASVRAYITAMGGTVRIVVSLDDTDVTLRLPGDPHTTAA